MFVDLLQSHTMPETSESNGALICACGRGPMVKRCIGELARNPGRHYFKCPFVSSHYRSFLWCEQLNRDPESTSCSTPEVPRISRLIVVDGGAPIQEGVQPDDDRCRRRITTQTGVGPRVDPRTPVRFKFV